MTTPPTPPTCIGTYEHQHPECDGDPPCTWRDKCGAFRAHTERTKSTLRRWLDGEGRLLVDPYHFDRQCQRWIATYDVIDGLPLEEAVELRRLSAPELFDGFLAFLVAEIAELGREFRRRGQLALPGDLYLVDKRETLKYAVIYCRATRRRQDATIAKIWIRPALRALAVWLPVAPSVAAKLALSARVLRGRGFYRSEISVDERNAEAMANKIVGLVEAGKIKLPPARRARK